MYNKLFEQVTREEWEFTSVHRLKQLFLFYNIESVDGIREVIYGTDILIKISGIIPNEKTSLKESKNSNEINPQPKYLRLP